MIHSTNQRLEIFNYNPLPGVEFFWGYRAFIDWALQFDGAEIGDEFQIVIADKGFVDRFNTVFSINRQWGRLGAFAVNPAPYPIEIAEPIERAGVLELGQDVEDFSYKADCAGYADWVEQWPDRRFRPHPKVERSRTSLADDLAEVGHCVGLNTSALITASMAGLRVRAYGAHSMANGINGCRSDRLRWLRSIEFDRRDPAQVEAIAAVLADPGRAGVCPEAESQTQASPPKSRRKRGKKTPARQARDTRGD